MSDLSPKSFLKTPAKSQTSPLDASQTEAGQELVLTVEQLNLQVKRLLEGQIGSVWVQGEISNFKAHTSGHFYFTLKDAKSQISSVMFRGNNSRLRFKPHDGLQVVVRGRLSVYEPRGNYQIVCDSMEPVGAGALQKAFEQLREKLKAEGLFDPARKRPIPSFPRHVAVVTSPTGAAIRDILNVMGRRAKSVRVTVVPTVVQGEAAAPKIREALANAFRLKDVDVIILGRGGGSIEDMWCFNDEELARLIPQSPVPVISAVGHEIDFTIADFVADLRAPTPSAAAELVAKSATELGHRVTQLDRLLKVAFDRRFKTLQQLMRGLSQRLIDPRKKLQDLAVRNDDLVSRLQLAIDRLFEVRRHRVDLLRQKMPSPQLVVQKRRQGLEMTSMRLRRAVEKTMEKRQSRSRTLMSLLDSLSPLKVVDRGYAIVTAKGKVLRSADQVNVGDEIAVKLAEGELVASVTGRKGT